MDLKNKPVCENVLVTGATGLIGYNLVNRLLNDGYMVFAQVRNIEKAKKMYGDRVGLSFVIGDILNAIRIEKQIDYIIHAASQTSSKDFVESPVETIRVAVQGTTNMLELAKEKKVKSFVYLSTMEVYGSPSSDEKIDEKHSTNIDTMKVRNSYPESKRLCEALCTAYFTEYAVPTKVIRLTQTFGPGVAYDDGRVFAEFARCVIENKNITLHTKGETKRNYLYTEDAVDAILTVLFKGAAGEAYNAANESTYCSIYEIAQLVAKNCAEGNINIRVELNNESKYGYAPTLKMNLDTTKLQKLGWKPRVSMTDMFESLIEDMRKKQ